MADLSVLRTAKLAMQEDLIDQADFDFIKQAFLKAQQIKAGMDAGFLRQEDFEQARDAFLKSLDFSVERVAPAAAAPQHAAAAHVAAPVAAPRHAPAPQPVAAAPAPRAAAPTPPPPPPAPMAFQQQAPPRMAPAASVRMAAPSGGSGGGAPPSGGLAEVNDLPRIGRLGIAAGKKSMSGISVNESAINVFNHMKTRSAFKWAVFKIDDAGNDVVTEAVGPSNSTYSSFTMAMPPGQCRYGVFDYAYTNNDTGQTVNKLVFVNWAPDESSTRTKMMYASTKDFFKGFLDGVGAELQATELCDIDEHEMHDRVGASITRK